jgi:hypothetical protein
MIYSGSRCQNKNAAISMRGNWKNNFKVSALIFIINGYIIILLYNCNTVLLPEALDAYF